MRWRHVFLAYLFLIILHSNTYSAEYDRFGGYAALKGKATGWFHVEQINGRWFFITPEGNGFFALGVTHTGETIRQDELGIFKTRFGGDAQRMGESFLQQMQDWGFNSAGYGALEMMESRIPYVATVWTEGPRSQSAGAKSKNTDIFDPQVQQRLRNKVRGTVLRHASNPFCLGYVFIDLPVWSLQPKTGTNYVSFLKSLPKAAPGRVEMTNYRKANSEADDEQLLNHIADTYYEIVCDELRKHDTHHLILGDRFMAAMGNRPLHTPDSILRTAAKYVDVITFQPMGTQQPILKYLDHVLEITGKPSLLADVNTMTMRPEKDATDTTRYETEAGQHTLAYYVDAASSTACLGLQRCTMRDFYPWDTQFHRRGLLKANDEPYSILIDFTRRTNQTVLKNVYGIQP